MICKGVKIDGSNCTRVVTDGEYCHQHNDQKYRELKPNDCIICCESLSNEKKSLDCGHWIHRECVIRSGKPECPVCRSPVTLGQKATKALETVAEKHRQDSIEEEEQNIMSQFEEQVADLILQALQESELVGGTTIEMDLVIPADWVLHFDDSD